MPSLRDGLPTDWRMDGYSIGGWAGTRLWAKRNRGGHDTRGFGILPATKCGGGCVSVPRDVVV